VRDISATGARTFEDPIRVPVINLPVPTAPKALSDSVLTQWRIMDLSLPSRDDDRPIQRDQRRIAVGPITDGRLVRLPTNLLKRNTFPKTESVSLLPSIGTTRPGPNDDSPTKQSPIPIHQTDKPLIKLIVDLVEHGGCRVETLDGDRVEFLTFPGLFDKCMMVIATVTVSEIWYGVRPEKTIISVSISKRKRQLRLGGD
jgi:hypothetical protein